MRTCGNFLCESGGGLPHFSFHSAKPLPLDHLVEIDVYRSSNPFPSGTGLLYSASGISLHIVDVEKVEGDTFFRQGRSLASQSPKRYCRDRNSLDGLLGLDGRSFCASLAAPHISDSMPERTTAAALFTRR
jgi:hypothetical protein